MIKTKNPDEPGACRRTMSTKPISLSQNHIICGGGTRRQYLRIRTS